MITIQKVSEALHLIETQVFKDLEINPFHKDNYELLDDVSNACSKHMQSDGTNLKETSIKLAASLTRLISELP